MSRLRQAQQIAAPADFQIVVGDAETGTRFGKFLDGLKPFSWRHATGARPAGRSR